MNYYYMDLAYKECLKALKNNEIPVGAVVVKDNKILAKSHNNRQKKHIIIGHAEINAIIKAEKKIKDWRLDGCEMYVTLYPCDMCKIIIDNSRINKIYYLCDNEISKLNKDNNYIKINDNYEYKELLKDFFLKLRK